MVDILYFLNGYNRPAWTEATQLPKEIGDMYELKKEYRIKYAKEEIEKSKLRIETYNNRILDLKESIKNESLEIKEKEKEVAELEKND